jgi:hypothetical protein
MTTITLENIFRNYMGNVSPMPLLIKEGIQIFSTLKYSRSITNSKQEM